MPNQNDASQENPVEETKNVEKPEVDADTKSVGIQSSEPKYTQAQVTNIVQRVKRKAADRFAGNSDDDEVEKLKAELEKAKKDAETAESRGRLTAKREQYAKEMNTKPEYLENLDEKQLDDLHSGVLAGYKAQDRIISTQPKKRESLVGW